MQFLRDLFIESFVGAHPVVQATILLVLLGLLAFLFWMWLRSHNKYREAKIKREDWRNKYDAQRLETEKQLGRINELTDQVENLQANVETLNEEKGRLEQKLNDEQTNGEKLVESRDHYKDEWQGLQHRINQLQELDANIWYDSKSGMSAANIPEFVPIAKRNTRFVSFLNLKGGVGKTTLVANLAAAFATGIVGKRLRVLVVDLDFQGTLSNRCVIQTLLDERRKQQQSNDPFSRNTAHRLLDHTFVNGNAKDAINLLKAPVTETTEHAWAIIASEVLESADFRQQAQFVVQEKEVRFSHRAFLHSEYVFENFDLVFFDCPPRVTTSVINSLTTADYVVIPTSLHPEDSEAVPRTLLWLEKLKAIPSFQARTAAVILNRTYRGGTTDDLTGDEKPILATLEEQVQKYVGDRIIRDVIRNHPRIAQYAAGSTPLGTSKEGHQLYLPVATELYQRIRS